MFTIAAHQFAMCLCDVDLRVQNAAIVLFVFGGFFVLDKGLYDLCIVVYTFFAKSAGSVDFVIAGDSFDAQHGYSQIEEVVGDLRHFY